MNTVLEKNAKNSFRKYFVKQMNKFPKKIWKMLEIIVILSS